MDIITVFSFYKVGTANMLPNSCLFTHPAGLHSCFCSLEECKSNIHSVLVSTILEKHSCAHTFTYLGKFVNYWHILENMTKTVLLFRNSGRMKQFIVTQLWLCFIIIITEITRMALIKSSHTFECLAW